jgi:hypothetical protein
MLKSIAFLYCLKGLILKELLKGSLRTNKKKQVVYRIDEDIVNEFRMLCKKHNLKQVSIIENTMKEIIKELKNEKL